MSSTRHWLVGLAFVATVLTGCTAIPPAAESAGSRSAPSTPAPVAYTPLVPTVLSPPRWFTGSDGTTRLVYELELLNVFPVPVRVTSIEVAPPGAPPLAQLTGPDLTAATTPIAAASTPATEVPPSSAAVVWLEVPVAGGPDVVPGEVQHTVTVTVPPGLPVPDTITYTGGLADVDRRPPVNLGPMIAGPGWVAAGSCCDGPHRRALQPINARLTLAQRFAIDWNRVDAQNRMAVGQTNLNESWVFYGAPVLAVTDATVVQAVDRYPDQVPDAPTPVTLQDADGNHVILDLGDGRFGFYAHLAPGSVAVKVGDRVCRGQQIGKLGNSGSSTGPHLHFHVMTGTSLDSDGLPFEIDGFTLTGRFPVFDDSLMQLVAQGQPVPVEPVGPTEHKNQLPLGRDVVSFPTPAPCG